MWIANALSIHKLQVSTLFTIVFYEMECITLVSVCNYQLVKGHLYGLVPFDFFNVSAFTHYLKKKKKKNKNLRTQTLIEKLLIA